MNRTRSAARKYSSLRWKVFPIAPESKEPPIKGWREKATDDPATIDQWFNDGDNRNLGAATGKPSGFWALDVDPGAGGEDSLEAYESQYGKLPDTVVQLTPNGGRHYLFRMPADGSDVRNSASVLPGIDVRGTGGYILLDPSIVRTRHGLRGYHWEESSKPGEVEIAETPPTLLALVQKNLPRSVEQPKAPIAFLTPRVPAEKLLHQALARAEREGRNNAGFWLTCQLRDNGYAQGEAEEVLSSFQREVPESSLKGEEEAYTKREASNSIHQAYTHPPREPWTTGQRDRFQPSDYGNAQRLATEHGSEIRYCHAWRVWLVWNGVHWERDTTGEVMRRAKATIRKLAAEASTLHDDEARRALLKHALKSESERSLKAMVELAQSEPGVPVRVIELDAHPWLLNCLNGTIDLQTGSLRPHRPEDLITKLAPVNYDTSARSDLWKRTLAEACGNDRELVEFFRRALGYSITGDTSEEVFFFLHGPGATGKSTILEAIKATLGDYAVAADFETFLARRNGGPRNDIARLAPTRFVVSVEVDEGKRLAEGMVKVLTGGDTVAARFLYQEFFEFRPHFKLWLAANQAPLVRSEDDAMWRRIIRIPFLNVLAEEKRDPQVKAALRDPNVSGSAILADLVQGCLEWQEYGLGIPPTIKQAIQEYREDMDPLRDFFSDRCILDSRAQVPSKDLWDAYKEWAAEEGERWPLSRNEFTKGLKARGCTPDKRGRGRRVWTGIGLGSGPAGVGAGSQVADVAEGGASLDKGKMQCLQNQFPETGATFRHLPPGEVTGQEAT